LRARLLTAELRPPWYTRREINFAPFRMPRWPRKCLELERKSAGKSQNPVATFGILVIERSQDGTDC
jgi:hypothetical protein